MMEILEREIEARECASTGPPLDLQAHLAGCNHGRPLEPPCSQTMLDRVIEALVVPIVDTFLSSVYADDVVSGSSDVETAYKFYEKSRQRLSVGGFRLRKFVTNSDELRARILRNESQSEDGGVGNTTHAEEDQSYAKSSLGVKMSEEQGVQKILGVEWNVASDNLQFDIGEVVTAMENSEPTKRSVVSATAKFFDPLGIVSSFSRCFSVRPS